MQEHIHGTTPPQRSRQATCMVKMSVANSDLIRILKPNVEFARVVFEYLFLSPVIELYTLMPANRRDSADHPSMPPQITVFTLIV
jgi:hypothetical protein